MDKDDLLKRGLIFKGRHLPYNPVDRAKVMRKHMTPEEEKLWRVYLRDFKPRFRRQHPIDNYIVDFYNAELKLVIEVDGEHHYTDGGRSYDSERDAIIESYGLKILRFSNADIKNRLGLVCKKIRNFIPRDLPEEYRS